MNMFEDEHRQPVQLPWSRQAEAIRRDFVKAEFEHLQQKTAGYQNSLAARLVDELTRDAVARVPEDHPTRDYALDDLLREAHALVFELMYAATSYEDDWEKRQVANFWWHNIHPGDAIKNKTYKLLQRYDIEGVAEQYVKGTVRGQLFDRTLVDMLLAFETYQFGDEMFHPFTMPGLPARSPLKWPHPLWAFVRDTFVMTVVLGGIGLLTSWAMSNEVIGSWGSWVLGICFVLWLMGTVFGTIYIPWAWSRWSKARKKTRELMEALLTTYSQMQSESVISAQHVLDSVKASAAIGVVWPSPVYVVLEDVIRRGGRL